MLLRVWSKANEQDAQALNLDVRASSGAMVRIRIRKSKPLKRLMQASRQALSLNAGEQLTFFSDGRTLRPEDTAASLGLTDGSILEVRTVAKKSPDSVVADNSLQVHMQPGSGKKKGFAASTSANDPYGTHSGPRCKRGKTEVGAIDNSISANIDASWERYRASRLAELRAELEDKWTHLVKDDQTVDLLAMRFGWGTSETLTVATGGRISEELDQLIAERVRAVARSSKSCDGIGSEETVQQTVSKHVDGLDNAILNASNDTALELLRKLALDEARMPSPLLIFLESCCSIKTLSNADVNSALARWPKLGEVHRKALWSIVLHRATLQDKAIEAVLHETGRQVQGAVSSARNAFTEFVEKQHSQNVTKGAVGMHPESVIDAQSAFLQKSEAELVAQLTIEHWPWQLPSKIDGFSLTGVL